MQKKKIIKDLASMRLEIYGEKKQDNFEKKDVMFPLVKQP